MNGSGLEICAQQLGLVGLWTLKFGLVGALAEVAPS